jgi:hypothetical protein
MMSLMKQSKNNVEFVQNVDLKFMKIVFFVSMTDNLDNAALPLWRCLNKINDENDAVVNGCELVLRVTSSVLYMEMTDNEK